MTTPYNIIEKVACSQGFPKGTADTFVPSYMSENIHNSNPDASRLLLIDGADHGMAYMTDPERYRAFVGEFVQGENRCINKL